ncbi:fatty acid synthase [Cavenderia fasciculata]|uniref:Fatty acid synthase n=1 Tax=Cavenderia fasciculata TaxID=261658 RepID=F4QC64_CACFS|nr:fatty acid synthase [Cavenderia fasciculata]EGG13551.1 fatty acid synthase [Cavenderia fasciculata]|eukprot:XP_004350255.1 fatty acid synthase [Cavenderia fasciculata]
MSVNKDNDIAIVGIGCRLPGGSRTPQQFYEQLVNGLDGISTITEDRWSKSYNDQEFIASERAGYLDMKEWTNFDRQFFGTLTAEASTMDPQVRLFMTVIWEALEDAHIDPASIRGSNTSVFVGQMFLSNEIMHNYDIPNMKPILRAGRSDTALKASYCYDFRGPALSVDTACSSSLVGILQGIDTIRNGDSDISICGGMNAFVEPTISAHFTQMKLIGKIGKCSSFDSSVDGYVRSEGVGVVILKRLSKAIQDNDNIYCVIKGGNCNADGNFEKSSPTAPSRAAQQVNTSTALQKTGLSPSDIYYVECQATGTTTGDPFQDEGIGGVFGNSHSKEQPRRIGSVKSNIGHTESTAGVASIIKCAMMLKNRTLIKNINFKELNPRIDLLDGRIKIVLENEPLPDDRVIRMGINSFGLTGSNSHVIVEEYRNNNINNNNNLINNNDHEKAKEYLIPFSANSKKSIDSYIDMIKNNTESYRNKMSFEDFVRYQSMKTNHPPCKKLIIADGWDSLLSTSSIFYEKQQTSVSNMSQLNSESNKSVVMVFCGQGAHWAGMGEKLYNHFQVFRESVDHLDKLLCQYYQYSIIDKLRNSNDKDIHHPILAQPSTFIIQVSLVKLYQHFGINPSIVVGHSFGDVTAAWCSGIVSLEEAARIVYLRSKAQNETIGSGRMLSVSLSHDKFNERFQQQFDDIEVACFNAEDSIVLAGDEKQLRLLDQQLKADNIFSAFLGTPCAFHSSKQESAKEFIFKNLNNNIKYECDKPTIPYFSTTTSRLIESSSEFNAQYIYDNLRQPVLFQQAINNIIKNTNNNNNQEYIYLEIAPHSTLSFYLKTLLSQQKSATILSPLNRKKDEVESIQSCLSQLYFIGANVNFTNQLPLIGDDDNEWKNRTRYLPRYQWDTEYLMEEQEPFKKKRLGGVSTTLLGICDDESLKTYESSIDINRPSYQYLKGHKVKGKYLFPGSGYTYIHIHHLEFIAPFFLKEGVPSRLKSSFVSSSPEDYQVIFQYYDSKAATWTKSSVGRLSIKTPVTLAKKYDVVTKLKKESYNIAMMTQSDVYEKLIKVGLVYGDTFKRVNNISFNQDGSILSEIDCSAKNKVQDFHIFSNNIPQHPCTSLFNVSKTSMNSRNRQQQRGNEFKGSLDIIDQHGNIIIKCESLICKSLTKVLKVHQAKNPSQFIKKSIYQPKNSPSPSSSENSNNVVEYLERYLKSSLTHKMIRVLDFGFNDILAINLIGSCLATLDSVSNMIIDFSTQDFSISFDFLENNNLSIKLFKEFNASLSLNDQGFLSNSYDIILSSQEFIQNNEYMTTQLYQLLNPNGQLVVINNDSVVVDENSKELIIRDIKSTQFNIQHINNNLKLEPDDITMICKKTSMRETNFDNIDKILFITPSSSTSSSPSTTSTRLISQASSISKQVKSISSDDISDESKYQSLLDSISYQQGEKVVIIYLESLVEMNSSNLDKKSMQLIRLHQILRKEQLPVKLITLITGQLNQCLVPICRDYDRPSDMFSFDSISISMDHQSCNQLSLNQIMQYANSNHIGEKNIKLECNDQVIQVNVERIIDAPKALELDSRLIVTDKQDIRVKFEKDSKYHLRSKTEVMEDYRVEVQVKAASINFKDLMTLEGRVDQRILPFGDIYDPLLGQDLAGIVTRIGPKVSNFKIGDEVFGSSHSFASSTLAWEHNLVHKPKELSFAEAASIPVAMGTAYVVLVKKAGIEPFESILIHSSTGGVGLTMLNLLKHQQHTGKVFVTVGSDEKKQYLEQHYGSLITAVLSYDNFTESVLEMTDGLGVNYVINTLDYTRMHDNFKCLYRNGMIIDLSVDQFFSVDNIDMGPFQFDKGYTAFQLNEEHIPYTNKIKKLIVEEGLEMPPIKVFPCQQILEAMEYIRTRKHIGKVVIDYEIAERDLVEPMLRERDRKQIERVHYQLDGVQDTLLMTGQTGVAVESLHYIIKHAPQLRDIIVVSYSSPKYEIQLLINHINKHQAHLRLHYVQCDIGNYDQLSSSIQQLYKNDSTIKPVKSVIHCANTYVFADADDVTIENHRQAMMAKAIGALNLHNLFEKLDWKLNHFHLLSSIAQYSGRESFSYAVANSFLDHLAQHRRNCGLAATAIIWGSIGSTGRVAISKLSNEALSSIGAHMMPLSTVYGVLRSSFIDSDTPFTSIICAAIKVDRFLSETPNLSHLFCHLSSIVAKKSNNNDNQDNMNDKIIEFIADLLSIEKNLLNGDTKLKDYGVDSMNAIQIKSWIEVEFKQSNIINQAQISNGTINSIIENVNRIIKK